MGYVFISYSSKSAQQAEAFRHLLHESRMETWMAPHDIPSGSQYAAVINQAIRDCRCFVLLLNDDAQASTWVPKEVERAIHYHKYILPVQLGDLVLNDAFEFYLADRHIVAVEKIDKSSKTVREILSLLTSLTAPPAEEKGKSSEKTAKTGKQEPEKAAGSIPGAEKFAAKENRWKQGVENEKEATADTGALQAAAEQASSSEPTHATEAARTQTPPATEEEEPISLRRILLEDMTLSVQPSPGEGVEEYVLRLWDKMLPDENPNGKVNGKVKNIKANELLSHFSPKLRKNQKPLFYCYSNGWPGTDAGLLITQDYLFWRGTSEFIVTKNYSCPIEDIRTIGCNLKGTFVVDKKRQQIIDFYVNKKKNSYNLFLQQLIKYLQLNKERLEALPASADGKNPSKKQRDESGEENYLSLRNRMLKKAATVDPTAYRQADDAVGYAQALAACLPGRAESYPYNCFVGKRIPKESPELFLSYFPSFDISKHKPVLFHKSGKGKFGLLITEELVLCRSPFYSGNEAKEVTLAIDEIDTVESVGEDVCFFSKKSDTGLRVFFSSNLEKQEAFRILLKFLIKFLQEQ